MKKEQNFLADQAKSYGFNKWTRDCGWQWYVPHMPYPFGIVIGQPKKWIKYKVQVPEL